MDILQLKRMIGFKMKELPSEVKKKPAEVEEDTFEDTLQNELLAQERKRRRVGRWEWLNKPFTLWVLTTIVVGMFTFIYSNYSTCRIALNTETDQLYRLAEEIDYRRAQFLGLLGPDNPIDASVGGMAALRRVLDPELTYSRQEFKGKWSDELVAEGERLLHKWKFVREDISLSFGKPLSNEVESRYYFGFGLRTLFYSVYDAHEFSVDISNADDDEKRGRVFRQYKFLAGSTLKDKDRIYTTMQFGWAGGGFTSPAVCLRRSIWPF